MILIFPDLNALRLALTGSLVPHAVTLAPAAVSTDADGRMFVEPTAALPKSIESTLKSMGVKAAKKHAGGPPERVENWLQILPVVKDPVPPQLSSQAPVLFELDTADGLPALVTEMLRLGNDRQSYRWFQDAAGGPHVLLRVVGPPYYTLLRALDRSAAPDAGGVRAYLERAPRVWVEVGHTHPLAAHVKPADGQLVLIRGPRDWRFLDDAPFRDVYDALDFSLPAAPVEWAAAESAGRLTVPLRLTAGNAADVPELWVIRENAVEQLDTLVRDADDRLTQRLTFAVATGPDGKPAVVVRTRPSRLPPPNPQFENAVGFRPLQKFTNLFVPTGKRLHPTLRRDAVRKLLADDPDRVVWLYPDGRGGFTPESVPDNAFRSMEDWVDYVIEAEQAPLAAWIEATRFDFDSFVCRENAPPKPKDPGTGKGPREKTDADDVKPPTVAPAVGKAGKGKPGGKGGPAEFAPAPVEQKPPSEWKVRRDELETRFLGVDGPLDAADRRALWPQLAEANTGLGDATEAAICWLNALWDADPPPPKWLAGWVQSEGSAAGVPATADDLDRRLKQANPQIRDAGGLVAGFLHLANQSPPPKWLLDRLPAVQKYVEANERALPVRAVWLAAYRLSQLAGSDVLGLARVRDRLLQRLLDEGMTPERDLPSFLRYAGLRDSERLRVVRDKALELHDAVRKWVEAGAAAQKNDTLKTSLPFIDLLFAFGLAKLGEGTPAKRLLEDAGRMMDTPIPTAAGTPQERSAISVAVARRYLFAAYRNRIENALAGRAHAGSLSEDVVEAYEQIVKTAVSGPDNNPHRLAKYSIDRLREQSKVLEPQERTDPYGDWTRYDDPVKRELVELHAVRDPAKLAHRIRKLYKEGAGRPPKDTQFQVLHETLPLAPRVGEAFTAELLQLVPAALTASPTPAGAAEPADLLKKQGELLERALRAAANYDRTDTVRALVNQFVDLVAAKPEETRFTLINIVATECLRGLRKFGLRDEIDRFLTRLRNEVLKGSKVDDLRRKYAGKPESWGAALQTLLSLAGGWLTFGLSDHAAPILEEARAELLGSAGLKLQAKNYTELARAYVLALGQGPSETGLPRITELFRKMDPAKITNTWTTAPYYSRLHLNLVEDVILALVSDEFALGAAGRKWLDDDEYLVRRRVHADLRREQKRNGL